MRVVNLVSFILAVGLLSQPVAAADTSPVAAKDGKTFLLEDINIYWLRNLGSEGLRAFFEDMVLYQAGLTQNLKPTEAEMKDYIDNVMGSATYQQFLQLYSERAVRQLVEVTLVSRKYETFLRDKIRREKSLTVTEAEARDFFLKNIDLYHLPEGAYLSIISVDSKQKADQVIQRLKNGENFSDIAAQANMDKALRDVKGELGLYRKGDGWLPKPLEDAGLALQTGQYSNVIEGQYFHILFCHQRSPEVSPAFTDVKDRLMQDLLEDKIDPHYFDAINELMKKEMPRFNIQAALFRPEDAPQR
jgi:hypothetical protein